MRAALLSCAMTLTLGATIAWATPVTWQATGVVQTMTNGGALGGIVPGTPWALTVSFEPTTPPTSVSGCGATTQAYPDAVTAATFQLGGFVYTNTGGNVFVNDQVPYGNCINDGLIQFEFSGPTHTWTGGGGGPDLNTGFLVAGCNDSGALGGALPASPSPCTAADAFAGLYWQDGLPNFNLKNQLFATFAPQAVPEPATSLLVLVGLGLLTRSGSALRARTGTPASRSARSSEA